MAKSSSKSDETKGSKKTPRKPSDSESSGAKTGAKSAGAKESAAKSAGKSSTARSGSKGSAAKSTTARKSKSSSTAKTKKRADAAAESSSREQVLEELNQLIGKLDEQMLGILKQQAEILTYSQKRTEVIRKVSEFQTAIAKGQLPDEGVDPNAAWVEQTDGGFFMICVGRDRIFFNRDELRELTRICWKAKDASQAGSRMYRWFERERRDFLNDTGIARPSSAALQNLYEHIVSHYKVKE